MIYILELEPLKERYTSWWHDFIPQQFLDKKLPHTIVTGEALGDSVEVGTVLDAAGTNHWKAVQLQKVCKLFKENKIKTGDHFLVTDIWFPGIEMIRYMEQLYDVKVFIWGVWHAGSSTNYDFAQPMHSWSKYFEIGFLNICNGVFVGTDYSKQSILKRLMYWLQDHEIETIYNKIHATGMPLDCNTLQQYISLQKKNQIVFPHRPDPEKDPLTFVNAIEALSIMWDNFYDYTFIFCTSKKRYLSSSSLINAKLAHLAKEFDNVEIREDLEKEDYYRLLGESKLVVSTTLEENFGYIITEAMALGANVLAPNNFSYKEILENDYTYLYDNDSDLLKKIISLAEGKPHKTLREYVNPYQHAVAEWMNVMSRG